MKRKPIDIIKLAKSIKHLYNGFYRMFVIGNLYGVVGLLKKSEKVDKKWLIELLFQDILENLE